ncbi:MAG: hypothetical protein ABI082_08640 [Dokdonella sp.]
MRAAGGPIDFGTTFGGHPEASRAQHGFVIRRGNVETVYFPGNLNSPVGGVNLFGAIAGVYWDADVTYHGVCAAAGTIRRSTSLARATPTRLVSAITAS